jgi:hypothetical protein
VRSGDEELFLRIQIRRIYVASKPPAMAAFLFAGGLRVAGAGGASASSNSHAHDYIGHGLSGRWFAGCRNFADFLAGVYFRERCHCSRGAITT